MSAVVRPASGPGTPGQQPHRTQIDVLIEALSNREDQLPHRHVIRHRRVADRAEIDRVEILEAIEGIRVHHRSRAAIELAAPGKVGELERVRFAANGAAQDVDAGGDHLLADPVAGDHCDVECFHIPGGVKRPSCASHPPSA